MLNLINNIDWGNDTAEKDSELLNYFVMIPNLDNIKRFSYNMVLGRKGSGKSAIKKKIIEDFKLENKNKKDLLIDLSPDENIFESIKGLGQDGDEIFFENAWISFIYEKILIGIGKKVNNEKKISSVEKKANAIYKQITDNLTLIDKIKDFVNRLKKINMNDYGVEFDKELKKIGNIKIYRDIINDLVDEGYNIKILIDDLDLGWDNSINSNNNILGLLLAQGRLIQKNNIKILIFLREDIYNILLTLTSHSDKFRNVFVIKWDMSRLIKLIVERIKFNVKTCNKPDDYYINKVFPHKIGATTCSRWLIDKTLYRPRELLQLLRLCSENVTDINKSEGFKKAEDVYSSWKIQDLSNEFKEKYKDINLLLNSLTRYFFKKKYTLSKNEYESIILKIFEEVDIKHERYDSLKQKKDTLGVIKIFFEIGLIGSFILGGEGGSKAIYSYSEGISHRSYDTIQIHPCFRKYLGTIERIH